ncbi:MAG: ABC transporter permease, partial [Clostridia bacterium]|nr:ABC transporter permease [Clostridia bacterium]
MVKRAALLSSLRLFRKHFARFLTIAAICVVAVGLTSGLGEVEEQIKHAATEEYREKAISDLYLKSKHTTGFTDREQSYLASRYGEENILYAFCMEFLSGDDLYRLYAFDFSQTEPNKMTYYAGGAPTSENEVVVERATYGLKSYDLSDTVTLSFLNFTKDLTVSGVCLHPLFLYARDNVSFQDPDRSVDYVLYLDYASLSALAGFDFTWKNDAYVLLSDSAREKFDAFSDRYEKIIDSEKEQLEKDLGTDAASYLSLYENMGMFSLVSYAEKVGLITVVFVVFFLLITLLVVYSAMSRLFTEERKEIACQKTLGYSEFDILKKYLFFDFAATAIGGAIAYGVGLVLT